MDMKKVFLKSVFISAVVILGGCGSSAGTGSSNPNNDSDYTTDTSSSDYTTDTTSSSYPAEERDIFVTDCTNTGADINICVCMYDYLVTNLSYSDYKRFDNEVRNGASTSDYPVLTRALEYCRY